jgi:hypothetical protein
MAEVVGPLGYSNLASAWKIEKGLEGLPTKRVYAWADILQVPRDAFFRFVTGEAERMELSPRAETSAGERLTSAEAELLAAYRRLPSTFQRRLRKTVQEFETLARATRKQR